MDITLRHIADALWKTRGDRATEEERQRIYDRARMLRDKGLIATTNPRSQGKTMVFTEADAAAAVVAITASLNGSSWGIIELLNAELRTIGNTMGKPMFETFIEDIKAGVPVFARLDLIIEPWSHSVARMGYSEIRIIDLAPGTTQSLLWPVTDLTKPVLDALEGVN